MIYVARLLSMIGAAMVVSGAAVLGLMIYFIGPSAASRSEFFDPLISLTFVGGIVLFAGQKLGNDLFRVRKIYERPRDYDSLRKPGAQGGVDMSGGGCDFGGGD